MIQLNQIEARILDKYRGKIDTSDAKDPEMALRTRGLAAWSVEELSGCTEAEAAASVVDDFGDNGVDAIHIDATNSTVYLVQSKWSVNGTGSAATGDIHKFVKGFEDLVNAEFSRFNTKLQAKQSDIEAALSDPEVKFILVLAHTGSSPLAKEGREIIDDLLLDVNDPIETASFESLTQAELHGFLRRGVRGAQPDLRVTLHDWGYTQDPYSAYYGQVDAAEIADWYATYKTSLFDKNLREFLGRSSEVNASLMNTLRNTPERFWYLNNGITVLCESVRKAAAGATMKKSGQFEFVGVSVVNGAQTVGCIAEAAAEDADYVADARVTVRFISLENCPDDFASEVTRGTNTQNRVERRDFVALDKEQVRIREELAIDGITYVIKSGEPSPPAATGLTVVEATVALACADPSSELAVQAKREIGRLWVGAESPKGGSQYRRLFNSSTSGPHLWRYVRTLREIDACLLKEQSRRTGRDRQIGVHGNRLLAHIIFQDLGAGVTVGDEADFAKVLAGISSKVKDRYDDAVRVVGKSYGGNYLASLFKNATRCADVAKQCLAVTHS
ncbi:AIPR family protein [Phycicoccus sp. M110.8]|uniref:AIPR family protein n=1 Tax=Phycicoccus sp. M110.8 TaxID=3075433 RepID=UPI0028FD80E6|nr:AIPR family protein [Phycicoccus sp. M110.8]MDU0312769.1 AIPR family protein [Phycicoccus sp. M110.8]